jgi:small GTP-binding protein
MKNQDNISCKVVLVGDTGVGKTSIIERYINNRYDENQKTTLVSSYTFKKIDIKKYNKSVSLDIWDTAGQEVYRSLSKNFYLNASIGILVYDISRKDSFESIKEYWFEQLKTFGEENMIFDVVGNKMDLFQNEQISEKEAREFAKSIGAGYHLISCKQSVGIKDLFEDCAKKYLETNKLTENNKIKENRNISLSLENKQTKEEKKKCC